MIDKVAANSEAAIRLGSKSFAAAARLLPRSQREDAFLLYAWCRHCDDVIDGQALGFARSGGAHGDPRQRMEELRASTLLALDSDAAVAGPFEALRRVVRRHDIPRRYPLELLAGMAMDVEGRVYRTIDETLDYAYHVAGVVGVMMALVLGVRDQRTLDRASDLGIAFQLTNIARDVIDDMKANRVYLPRDWLLGEGLERAGSGLADETSRLHRCAQRLLAAAEPYYSSALHGIAVLPPRSAWAIAAARRIYRDIGIQLDRGGPDAWRSRISVPTARKLLLTAQALGDVIRLKRSPAAEFADRSSLRTRS